MNQNYEELMSKIEKAQAFQEALSLFEWDNQTLAPKMAMDNTAKTIGLLSNEFFSVMVNDRVKELIYLLSEEKEAENLTFNQKAIVKQLKKTFDQLEKIPPAEYQAYSELTAKASSIWAKAKEEKNFDAYKDTLGEIISYQKKFASYRQTGDQKLYDILLDDFEEGFTMEMLDQFFDKMKAAIIPLVKKISEKQDFIKRDFLNQSFSVEQQKKFSKEVAAYVGFDFDKGVIAESAHPFTLNLHNKDVRITTHYLEQNLESAIFSTIHECGHGIYEMNIADELTQTPVGGGTSMGVHESQSRFFENVIGRSEAFWVPLYEKLQAAFPGQLDAVSREDFVAAMNYSKPGLIRTEADELTYSLHVLIRYEIEKMIFADQVTVEELPALWNQKYQEYLGLTPSHDGEGVLQDIHWAGGSFGYFPSYALGSAIAAQIYDYMKSKIDVEDCLVKGNLKPIEAFLKEHIHQYGATKNTKELLLAMSGEAFNSDYYIAYLTDKYTKLYQL